MSGTYTHSGSGYVPMIYGSPISGLGASPFLSTVGYETATVLGAAAGGGLVGYVAAKSGRGAIRGAAFSSGLALVADGVGSFRESATTKGAVLSVLGVLVAGWSVRDMMRKRR
jgi:hypothetical protein